MEDLPNGTTSHQMKDPPNGTTFESKLLMLSTLSVLTCAAVQIFQNQEILFKIQHFFSILSQAIFFLKHLKMLMIVWKKSKSK